jgi:hypothetical protein
LRFLVLSEISKLTGYGKGGISGSLRNLKRRRGAEGVNDLREKGG